MEKKLVSMRLDSSVLDLLDNLVAKGAGRWRPITRSAAVNYILGHLENRLSVDDIYRLASGNFFSFKIVFDNEDFKNPEGHSK